MQITFSFGSEIEDIIEGYHATYPEGGHTIEYYIWERCRKTDPEKVSMTMEELIEFLKLAVHLGIDEAFASIGLKVKSKEEK